MTIQELIEFAVLDVLGLLEESERRDFERDFAACAPAVQAMIRREQLRLSNIERWLPDVQAPVHLRAQVIEAVRRAVESEEAGLAEQSLAWAPPEMVPTRRVSPLWRATALASLTAALVMGATTLWLKSEFRGLEAVLRDNQFSDQTLLALGPKFKDYLYGESVRHVVFRPSSEAASSGEAVLLLDPEAGKAYLVCRNLEPTTAGRPYSLVVITDDGTAVEKLGTFASNGRYMGREFRVTVGNGTRLAIQASGDDGRAEPVLTTGPLPQS